MSAGGVLCPHCSQEEERNIILRGETLALLKLLSQGQLQILQKVKASPQAEKEIEIILERYLEYHLETRFNLKNTIRTLKSRLVLPG